MKFLNIRRAFATNSSSSHSMILLNEKDTLSDRDTDFEDYDYGWEAFTLVSDASKKDYLRALIGQCLSATAGYAVAQTVLDDMGLSSDSGTENFGSVDHQSRVYFPKSQDQSGLNVDFLKDFVGWAMKKNVAILGGNDNGGKHPAIDENSLLVSWQNHFYDGNLIARKDEKNNTWSVFSKRNGLNLRISFDEDNPVLSKDRPSEEKSSRPNLVDIKITNKCPYKCTYCYQGSTPSGVHAPLERVFEIAEKLREAEVFEVAIGGGEPTVHPGFRHIVAAFDDRGITPNFTTRNLVWLRDSKNRETIMKCGGIAFSVDNPQMAQELAEFLEKTDYAFKQKFRAQVVVGAQSEENFKDILKILIKDRVQITFLGYKTTGFGQSYKDSNMEQVRHAEENWIRWFLEENKSGRAWVTIDTALAQVSDEELQSRGVSSNLYHRTEGTNSMYIDAVENKMAPSSFCDNVREFNDDWLSEYESFQQEKPSKKIKMKMV